MDFNTQFRVIHKHSIFGSNTRSFNWRISNTLNGQKTHFSFIRLHYNTRCSDSMDLLIFQIFNVGKVYLRFWSRSKLCDISNLHLRKFSINLSSKINAKLSPNVCTWIIYLLYAWSITKLPLIDGSWDDPCSHSGCFNLTQVWRESFIFDVHWRSDTGRVEHERIF